MEGPRPDLTASPQEPYSETRRALFMSYINGQQRHTLTSEELCMNERYAIGNTPVGLVIDPTLLT
jgi:hypothetical protein